MNMKPELKIIQYFILLSFIFLCGCIQQSNEINEIQKTGSSEVKIPEVTEESKESGASSELIPEVTNITNESKGIIIRGVWEPGLIYSLLCEESDEIKKLGINTVHIIVNVNDEYREYIGIPGIGRFEGEEAVRYYEQLIDKAKNEGFHVILILEYIVDVGERNEPNRKFSNLEEFMEKMENLAIKWSYIAEEHNVDIFSPINEFDRVLYENGIDNDEIIKKEEEFYSKTIPEINKKYSGIIYCKLGSVHQHRKFNATFCDLVGIVVTGNDPTPSLSKFREDVREYLKNAQEISKEYDKPWIVGEFFVPKFFTQMSGISLKDYYNIAFQEYKSCENKASGFVFMGWKNPFAPIKETDAKEDIREFFSHIEEYSAPLYL